MGVSSHQHLKKCSPALRTIGLVRRADQKSVFTSVKLKRLFWYISVRSCKRHACYYITFITDFMHAEANASGLLPEKENNLIIQPNSTIVKMIILRVRKFASPGGSEPRGKRLLCVKGWILKKWAETVFGGQDVY